MSKEGWIYFGTNKNSDLKEYIKIGRTGKDAASRENNTNGAGLNNFFAIKVDDREFYEKLIHKMLEQYNYKHKPDKDERDNWKEWFCIKFENLLPFLLEIATDFEIRDKDYCTKICKTIKENGDFYKVLIKREPSKYQKLNQEIKDSYGYCQLLNEMDFKQEEKPEPKNQSTPQNKVCKYETKFDSIGRPDIDWDLFFEDHKKQLVGKKVYPSKQPNNVAELVKLETPIKKQNYGILYKGDPMTFNDFFTKTTGKKYAAYNYILFCENDKTIKDKTIKQVYNELKFK